jgi:hypothetical protein
MFGAIIALIVVFFACLVLRGLWPNSFTFRSFLSPPFLARQAITLWLIMRTSALCLSFRIGVAVYVIVGLDTALPSTPANVGSFSDWRFSE